MDSDGTLYFSDDIAIKVSDFQIWFSLEDDKAGFRHEGHEYQARLSDLLMALVKLANEQEPKPE